MSYRTIDPSPIAASAPGLTRKADPGPKPQQRWFTIAQLRIDETYQRHVLRAGMRNVVKIAMAFRWSRFIPVVVAPAEGGGMAIIDGQHRTLAAALIGIAEVPCYVVDIDREEQARAFAAINGQVTPISILQLHASRVASGDLAAISLNEACGAAGVTICRYPVPGNKMKVGETTAVGSLAKYLASYGRAVLVAALKSITRTGDGHAGYVRAPVVGALCAILEGEPAFCSSEKRLLAAMGRLDFEKEFIEASNRSRKGEGSVESILVETLGERLERAMAA